MNNRIDRIDKTETPECIWFLSISVSTVIIYGVYLLINSIKPGVFGF